MPPQGRGIGKPAEIADGAAAAQYLFGTSGSILERLPAGKGCPIGRQDRGLSVPHFARSTELLRRRTNPGSAPRILFHVSVYKRILDFGYPSPFFWGQPVVLSHYAFSFPLQQYSATQLPAVASIKSPSSLPGFRGPAHGVARACRIARSPPCRTETRPGLGLAERSPGKISAKRESAAAASLESLAAATMKSWITFPARSTRSTATPQR
jgi:hypothetical protein